ncbi:MAG TPA: hypothetical protein ENH84_04665 [Phycisphaerae bacterium]|nr:hypothetical protein [Phycisphaerae bacterium]
MIDSLKCSCSVRAEIIDSLRRIALDSLKKMYLRNEGLFAFRIRRGPSGELTEGTSRRYTAIALIGLAGETPPQVGHILAGHDAKGVCSRLVEGVDGLVNLGDVALILWACRAWGHAGRNRAVERLIDMKPDTGVYPVVELAWALTALTVCPSGPSDLTLADRIARRLIHSQSPESGLFPHWPIEAGRHWLRGHVACFADLVYPIQALSRFHKATGCTDALAAAKRCARSVLGLQGDDGQWWWHYDVRTGRVLERYPVYSVHQDSMAPMALLSLPEDCLPGRFEAINRSLNWLVYSGEIGGSLVDHDSGIIWRKVARKELAKISRKLQAVSSRLHSSLRAPLTDRLFPPIAIDFESRPYHMGWILHTWPATDATHIPLKSNETDASTFVNA